MWRLLLITLIAVSAEDTTDNSRKVLGSSVVTSVSVIMDAGNGSKVYADAVGKPMAKPSTASDLASPIDLLNPDRYEFYTFDDSGDLVKRLMTLEEIQDIIATGISDGFGDSLTQDGLLPEKRVNDVVNNVQNVLKEEMKTHLNQAGKPPLDTPDVSDSWSMILPAVFGNSGEDIKPEPPITHVTPDTIMIEPTIMVSSTTEQISTSEKVMTLLTKKTTPTSTTSTTEKTPMINVEIITNSNSTTEKTVNVLSTDNTKVVEIKPPNNFEMTKENPRPSSQVFKSTSKPLRPTRSTVPPSTRLTTPRTTTTARPRTPQTSTSPLTTSKPTTKATRRTTTRTTTKPIITTARTRATTTSTTPRPPTTTRTRSTTTTTTTAKPTTTLQPETTTQTVPTTTQIFTTTELPSTTTELFETTTTTEPVTITTLKSTELPEISTLPPSLSTFFTVIDNKESTSTGSDDLNTLSTEYVTVKTITNSTLISTTEPQSTEKSANLLEQYLLTSTNIYEINSELSDASDSTVSTTDTTEKVYIRLKNPTEPPASTTTDQTFIDTIEQLISQAVGTPAPPEATEIEAVKVQELLMNSANKTGADMMKEAATLASNMMDVNGESTTESTTTIIPDLLSDSVSSLLSQVYGQGSTTIEDTTVTTTVLPEPVTVESSSYVPHIINITIIRNENRKNQSKPAKSDLSLEMDYEDMLKEIQKNSTLASMLPNQELLKGEASSSIVEEKFNETDEATTVMDDLTTTEEITTTEDPTTTTITSTTTTTKSTSTTTSPSTSTRARPSTSTTTKSSTSTTTRPSTSTTTMPSTTITTESKPSTTTAETKENNWTLVSTLAPHESVKFDPISEDTAPHVISTIVDPPPQIDLVPKPMQGFGLEDSTARLDGDIYQFVQLCNELAFGFWKSVTTGLSSARSVVVSPFAATSLLAMVFLGARGATSGEMNEILKLDDMVTFNPHLIFKNVTESIQVGPNTGVGVSTIVRELFSDRSKGKLLGFYKERVRQFYDGHVEEASFREIGDVIRRRTNLLVKKATDGKVAEFLKDGSIIPKPPLAGVSVSIFQGDCSTDGRNGELHFVVLPSLRQRRLIPIPSTIYQSGFLAGYEPSLDATAAAIGTKDRTISTIFVMPGQQGMSTPGDGLARLEKRLVESAFKKGAWGRLLRSLIPRPGLELQIPRFQHRSVINATQALKKMGLEDLFSPQRADLKGLNGAAHELHLSDVIQVNEFGTCAGEAHREMYPATAERKGRLWEEPGDYLRAFHDPLHDPSFAGLPLALRPRQARLPDSPRLRFDRPFLFLIRHNPSGLILHMGRFHPRLLP